MVAAAGGAVWMSATLMCFFKSVTVSDEYKDRHFMVRESMGRLITLLMYFQSENDLWTGLIFLLPLFVIRENMKSSNVILRVAFDLVADVSLFVSIVEIGC